MIALADKRPAVAAAELQQANQQDPRVLHMTAQALLASGKADDAAKFNDKGEKFNGLSFNYAYLRAKTETGGTEAAK